MKNAKTMMLMASLVAMVCILHSCSKKDKFLAPVVSIPADRTDSTAAPADSTGNQTDSTDTDTDSTGTITDSTTTVTPDSTVTNLPDTTVTTDPGPDTTVVIEPQNPTPEEPTTQDPEPENPLPVATQFDQITRAHVAAKSSVMSDDYFETSNNSGVLWQPGDVYVFTTNEGRLGKFQVKSIVPAENYKLTIHVVTFNEDGTVHAEKTGLVINGTWACDLDAAQESVSFAVVDFAWSRSTSTITYFGPMNGAKFFKYSFN
jgi:hypothetical protein